MPEQQAFLMHLEKLLKERRHPHTWIEAISRRVLDLLFDGVEDAQNLAAHIYPIQTLRMRLEITSNLSERARESQEHNTC